MNSIKKFWANFTKSPEQKYLEKATDLCDLEKRLKNIEFNLDRVRNY
jgi:hypothetical protein|tara:strand:- start:4799 stop:4939 length:141 start_codon:yes stop_codon:yes gene_type:complete